MFTRKMEKNPFYMGLLLSCVWPNTFATANAGIVLTFRSGFLNFHLCVRVSASKLCSMARRGITALYFDTHTYTPK